MRLSTRTISLLLAIAVPLSASATGVAVSLGGVIGIVQSNKKPLAFELAMKGTMGDASGSATITGTHNGNMKSLKKAALEMTIMLDAKADAESWGHAEFKSKLVDEMLYVRLEDFTAKGEWAAYINYVEPYVDVWYSFPVDPKEYEQFMKSQKKSRNASYKEIEALFKVIQEELHTGKTRYTMTIPKNRQRRMISRILGPDYTRTYRNASVDARLSVETLKDVFDSFTGSLDISAIVNNEKMSTKVTGKANVLTKAPFITAPAESTPFQELLNERYGSSYEREPVDSADARDAQRRSDINTILNAVYQYSIDHDGELPKALRDADGDLVAICRTGVTCTGISLDVLNDSYLVRMPIDPSLDDDKAISGYMIQTSSSGRISVSAPYAEGGTGISVTR
jgi:hypothetical protein